MSQQNQTTSGHQSPVRTMFDVQRTATRQSEQAMKQAMQTGEATTRVVLNGLRMQETLQRQGLEIAQAATRSYLDTVEAMAGTSRATGGRRGVDETFAQLKETHGQFFQVVDEQLRQGVDSYEELSEEYFDALDETTDQLIETADTLEDQSVEGFDQFNRQLHDQLERTQEMQDELEDQFEEGTEQAEQLLQRQADQAEEFQEEIERQGERVQQQVTEGAQRAQQMTPVRQGGGTAAAHDLEEIDGIGTATKEDLQEAGVETIDDLSRADPAMVAEITAVSEDRAQEWIDQATDLVGQPA